MTALTTEQAAKVAAAKVGTIFHWKASDSLTVTRANKKAAAS